MKSLLKAIIKRKLKCITAPELDLVQRLRAEIASLPDLVPQNGSRAAEEWLENRMRLREMIQKDDPRRFLEWDVIGKTMFMGSPPYIAEELRVLQSSGEWPRWRRALQEDRAGLPARCRFRLSSSGNRIHHAHTLYQFEQATGRRIASFPRIAEFGGGYGGFCRLIHKLGFDGEYLIFDLPEFSALQRYYLASLANTECGANANDPVGIDFTSDLSIWNQRIAAHSGWLFIGMWSISETSVPLRRDVLTNSTNFASYLLAFQDQFGEVDNLGFFSAWMRAHKAIKWTSMEIVHLPGNRYLFGASPS